MRYNFRDTNSDLRRDNFYRRVFFVNYSSRQLKRAILKSCTRESSGELRLKPYFWSRIRIRLISYHEKKYGPVPDFLKVPHIKKGSFNVYGNKEWSEWWRKA
jgi:hypothetical protein